MKSARNITPPGVMGTRSVADIAPTPATMALNAYIYGYGGHSLVTPHAQLKQLWWTDKKIDAEVTRSYVVRNLRLEERAFLNKPLAFGEGLTDDTYMDWILERAKRLFRILTEVGVPDQIFGCVDDSWDDDDLPIPLEIVEHLQLTDEYDAALNRRFYNTQFRFLLRELKQGSHIDYGPSEHIPMEHVNTIPPAVSLQVWDRVHFPGRVDEVYMRRKYWLMEKDSGDRTDAFLRDVRKAQALPHEHIAPVWASYTSENKGYIVSNFVGEHTLGTFIDHRTPQQFVRVPASERPIVLCEWMHCLADALACLHHNGVAHSAIRPSSILIDHDNHIAFSDVGSIRTLQRGKKTNKAEIYNYAAPESQLAEPPASMASSPPISSVGAFNRLRKMSSSTSSSSASSHNGSTRDSGLCTPNTSPSPLFQKERCDSLTNGSIPASPPPKLSSSFRNFSRHISRDSSSSFRRSQEVPPSMTATEIHILPKPTIPDPDSLCELPRVLPEMSDIFSLACVFLDILTFLVKGKINDFVKFRTTKISSLLQKGRRTRTDQSFHANPDKIEAWVEILMGESEKRNERVFRGVPALLRLVRAMMMQNATLRPSAQDVRDRLRGILEHDSGITTLCCADRIWPAPPVPHHSVPATHASRTMERDSLSVATGLYANTAPPHNGSDSARSGATRADDHELSRAESQAASVKSRRRSSASTATVKLGNWRRAFSSSSSSGKG